MRESGFDRHYRMQMLLKMAAYRAVHEGRNPPLNSLLWSEHARLYESGRRFSLFGPLFQPRRRRPDWRDARPLERYPVEVTFLTDDFSAERAQARLLAWPMVDEFQVIERDPAGEWFTCRVEVIAESRRHARQIVECIFSLQSGIERPEIESL